MNYDAFMEPITWFLTGMEKHSDEMRDRAPAEMQITLLRAMTYHMANMLAPSLLTAMNELSNHDHSRFLNADESYGGPCGRHWDRKRRMSMLIRR